MKILPVLAKCKNILEHMTHLSIVPVADLKADNVLRSLFEHCKNLISLSINLTYQSIFGFEIQAQCLRLLKNLDKLEAIRVCFEDIFSF